MELSRGVGSGAVPVSPVAGTAHEKDRERTTWLVEDHEIWTDGLSAVPAVIGGAAGERRRGDRDERDFLNEEDLQAMLDRIDAPEAVTSEEASGEWTLGQEDGIAAVIDGSGLR